MEDGENVEEGPGRDKALRSIGRQLGKCFREDVVTIDNFLIERSETRDDQSRTVRTYRFRPDYETLEL